jgi:hypothetical protein
VLQEDAARVAAELGTEVETLKKQIKEKDEKIKSTW